MHVLVALPSALAGGSVVALALRRGRRREVSRAATRDALTGLPNRTTVRARLAAVLAAGRGSGCGLLLADIDDFKVVNDSLGHPVGDEVLVAVAARLRDRVRPTDTVARVGGDEFAVVVEDVTAAELEHLAQRLVDAFRAPFPVGDLMVRLSVSVGMVATSCPHGCTDGCDVDSVMRNADLAMYAAKRTEGSAVSTYHPTMHDAVVQRLRLEVELHDAIERREFVVAFQPLVRLSGSRVMGAEALVRWAHPERGMLGPAEFLPLAEETGLINQIGHWVLREAVFHASRWRRLPGHGAFMVSVNVSARQFERDSFVAEVRRCLIEAGLPGEALVLELTETVLMADVASSAEQLSRLKALGVQVAVDDFGTGYSSLAYLRQFPVDALKVDRTFVAGVAADGDDNAVVRAVCQLGAALGLEVVAEGIETAGQLDALRALRCGYGQGYLFGAPDTPEAMEALLHGQTPDMVQRTSTLKRPLA